MKNTPPKIYLNINEDVIDFKKARNVSWSEKRLHLNDIEYTFIDNKVERIKDYIFNTSKHYGKDKNIEEWYLLDIIKFIKKL